jgi:hypothetical protein
LLFYRAITIENLKSPFITLDLKTADLDSYLGICKRYFSLITVTNNTKLMAQATGQGAFPLTAIKDTFEFRAAGITLEFNPIANQMTILQGGTRNVLTKSNLKLKDLVLGIFTISNSLLRHLII